MDDSEGDARGPCSVLILASTYPRWEGDSVPAFVAQYAQQLRAAGLEVMVLAPHHRGASRSETVDGVRVRRFRYWWPARGQDIAYGQYGKARLGALKGATYTLAQIAATARLARGTDVVNAHWLVPQGFAAAVATLAVRRPLVVTVHGGDVFTLRGAFATRLKRWTLGRARAVVVNGSATHALCRELRDRDYRIVPMGVPDRFAGAPSSRDDGALRLLFVGRLAEGKGADDAVAGLAIAVEQGVDATLVIAGSGPERVAVEGLADRLGVGDRVSFAGWVDPVDLPALYAESDALVAPSTTTASGWQEAFGLVLVEAALSGIPAIATRSGGIPDVVVDGETGILVDEHRPDQIAGAVASLAVEPALRARMGAAARQRAGELFTWEAVMPRHLAALADALG
ncbi:glycosyltransferase [Demequina sp. NBRC 110054]|uniref:glycosyltransferase n=1 Tax=Demequina sp. NBRC 110054 TaxID=1570343 RepID=UPI000A01A6E9|nr:glycosyltransferase [Demequina sp. NBRC 110054]